MSHIRLPALAFRHRHAFDASALLLCFLPKSSPFSARASQPYKHVVVGPPPASPDVEEHGSPAQATNTLLLWHGPLLVSPAFFSSSLSLIIPLPLGAARGLDARPCVQAREKGPCDDHSAGHGKLG